jgi:hypothetical protein
MSDRTQFAIGGRKVPMPRVVKRSLQIAIAAALTAGVVLAIVLSNSVLMGRGGSLAGLDIWLAFIRRTDIIGTIILTALVTVSFVYWQRDRERR